MAKYLKKITCTPDAKAVLVEGRKLWKAYYQTKFGRTIRDDLALDCEDVGWYQIRRALELNSENVFTDFIPFREAYAKLGEKLRPQVFEFGFLME